MFHQRVHDQAEKGFELSFVPTPEELDCGFKNPELALEDLGFTVVCEGLDAEKSRIKKRV